MLVFISLYAAEVRHSDRVLLVRDFDFERALFTVCVSMRVVKGILDNVSANLIFNVPYVRSWLIQTAV